MLIPYFVDNKAVYRVVMYFLVRIMLMKYSSLDKMENLITCRCWFTPEPISVRAVFFFYGNVCGAVSRYPTCVSVSAQELCPTCQP